MYGVNPLRMTLKLSYTTAALKTVNKAHTRYVQTLKLRATCAGLKAVDKAHTPYV